MLYFAAAMLLITAGAAITDKRIGAWLRDPLHRTDLIFPLLAILILATIRYVSGSFDAMLVRWNASMGIVLPLVTLALIASFLRWSLRRRWAGDLLRGFVYPRKARLITVVVVFCTFDLVFTFLAGDTVQPKQWNFLAVFLVAWMHRRWIESRIEIRDRGILYRGSLIPWLRMVSYRREEPQYSDDGNVVLRLNVRRPLPFLVPYSQMELRKEDSDVVDDILRRNVAQI